MVASLAGKLANMDLVEYAFAGYNVVINDLR